jgi:hypothetical protein
MAEVDGNRTRRRRIATTTRFEGGGRHQVAGHLRQRLYGSDTDASGDLVAACHIGQESY